MEKPKNHKDQTDLTPEHVDWLVEHRFENQKASAKLFRLLKKYPKESEKFLDDNTGIGRHSLLALEIRVSVR